MLTQDGKHDDVSLDVFTSAGVFRGLLRVPRATTLLDFLNRAGEHLRLAEAHVEGDPQSIPFLAVRRENIRLVVPLDAHGIDIAAQRHADDNLVEMAGVMDACRIRGRVRLAQGQRVTDFLATAPAFVALRDCTAWRAGTSAAPVQSPVALVRAHAVIAFSDTLD